MSWQEQIIEKIAKKRLQDDFGQKGEEWYSTYVLARKKLAEDVLIYIQSVEPDLTDHGPNHVADVLFRAGQLLDGIMNKEMPSQDLYGLLLSILFHDVGNIFKREDHQKKVGNALKYVWPTRKSNRGEYQIVTQAVMAHCGNASDGGKDTLKEVEKVISLDGQPINLREIAAITRFADELAEGPQRTSAFILEHDLISGESKSYHEYAFETDILIDKPSGRIALTYDIEIDASTDSEWQGETEESLKMIYQRIIKLDQERQYSKYYCKHLAPFERTTVSFNFLVDDSDLPLDLNQITLTDLKVPGDKQKSIVEHDSNYEIPNIISSIKSKNKKNN